MFLVKSVIVWLFVFISISLQAQPNLKFIIRVDDILSKNTLILPRSIVPFQDSVESRGGKITWGVMPQRFLDAANADGNLATELKASAQRGHEISLHGWEHICQRCKQSSHEMYCTTYKSPFTLTQQIKLLSDGIDKLVEQIGVKPTSFIPPGHISDSTTWRALLDQGISFISTTTDQKNLVDTLFNLPPDGEYAWALTTQNYQENLTNALVDVRKVAEEKGVYMMYFHDFFIRSGYTDGLTLKWTAELMDSLNVFYGDKISYKTLSEVAKELRQEATSIESESDKRYSFSLEQNFPNPFNPTTQLSFTLSNPSKVELNVYTIQGQLISNVTNKFYSSGKHEVLFDASMLPSGVYLYSIRVNGAYLTRKMTLIK